MSVADQPSASWSILRVTPQMVRRVSESLTEAGLTVYAPMERYRPANHWRTKTRPLFSGYLFADLPDDLALDLARANHAVRDVMSRESTIIRLPALVIGTMILLEAWHVFDQTWKPPLPMRKNRRGRKPTMRPTRWEHGQRVRVRSGPFEGHLGDIMRTDRGDRIGVMLMIFGRPTPIEVDDSGLEAAA